MNVGAKSYPIRPKYLQIKFCDSITSLWVCVCVRAHVCIFLAAFFLNWDFPTKD